MSQAKHQASNHRIASTGLESVIKPTMEPTMSEATDQNLSTERDFHGAAIIDENGCEVPITEEMIQRACNDLSNEWLFPRQIHQH
ncbi:MAG: hypothetical protein MI867_26865 [Pseudomonadales bacterium]|nr:hypothetical protein [Pseudomonadales bacterium]